MDKVPAIWDLRRPLKLRLEKTVQHMLKLASWPKVLLKLVNSNRLSQNTCTTCPIRAPFNTVAASWTRQEASQVQPSRSSPSFLRKYTNLRQANLLQTVSVCITSHLHLWQVSMTSVAVHSPRQRIKLLSEVRITLLRSMPLLRQARNARTLLLSLVRSNQPKWSSIPLLARTRPTAVQFLQKSNQVCLAQSLQAVL